MFLLFICLPKCLFSNPLIVFYLIISPISVFIMVVATKQLRYWKYFDSSNILPFSTTFTFIKYFPLTVMICKCVFDILNKSPIQDHTVIPIPPAKMTAQVLQAIMPAHLINFHSLIFLSHDTNTNGITQLCLKASVYYSFCYSCCFFCFILMSLHTKKILKINYIF